MSVSFFFRLIGYTTGIPVPSLSLFSHVACRVETKKAPRLPYRGVRGACYYMLS